MPWPAIDPQFTWHYQLTLDPAFEETTEFSGPPLNLSSGLCQKQQWIECLLMFTCIRIEKANRIHPITQRIEFT